MKTNNVLETMQQLAEKHIKLYKTDFYDYDVPRIKKEHPSEFVWMVRETGTHIMTPCDSDDDKGFWRHCYDIFSAANKMFFYCTMNADGSGTVTKSTAKCLAFADRQSR